MPTIYAKFLEKHRAAIVPALYDVVAQTTPVLAPSEVHAFTERLVDLYISFCLGETHPEIEAIRAENRRRGVTPELARPKSAAFIEILRTYNAKEKSLTESERAHISRMLDSSFRYMQTMTLGLRPVAADETSPA